MANPLAFFKIAFRALKGIFTGEILCQEDIEIGGDSTKVSLLLKRDRRLRSQYVVFIGNGKWFSFIELQEFDHFIEAADAIRAAQTFAIDTSPHAVLKLGQLTDMITMGEVLRRIDTPTMGGELMMSLRLKRDRATLHEYVVLGTIALGWWLYYPFGLDEFHRFVASAKRIRAAAD